MSSLRITPAVGDYDITGPLIDGTVEPQGLDLLVIALPAPQRHWRMLRHMPDELLCPSTLERLPTYV